LGARIEASNPISLLDIDWTRQNYCLVAGGIGITPISAIAAALYRRSFDLTLH
jgi:vanillate O-demethylase ferredoxin subunit